jgi:hypothetical protein
MSNQEIIPVDIQELLTKVFGEPIKDQPKPIPVKEPKVEPMPVVNTFNHVPLDVSIKIGKRVEIIATCKLPIGSQGDVFWYGDDKFRAGVKCVGLKIGGIKHFVTEEKVKLV